jgi:hypothetical protein
MTTANILARVPTSVKNDYEKLAKKKGSTVSALLGEAAQRFILENKLASALAEIESAAKRISAGNEVFTDRLDDLENRLDSIINLLRGGVGEFDDEDDGSDEDGQGTSSLSINTLSTEQALSFYKPS